MVKIRFPADFRGDSHASGLGKPVLRKEVHNFENFGEFWSNHQVWSSYRVNIGSEIHFKRILSPDSDAFEIEVMWSNA